MSDPKPGADKPCGSWCARNWLRDGVLVWLAVTLVGFVAVRSCVSYSPGSAPPPADVARAMAALRTAAETGTPGDLGPAAKIGLSGPVRVVLWSDGLPAFRGEFSAPNLGELVAKAAAELGAARTAGRIDAAKLAQARFHLSFIVAEGPVLSWPTLAASISFVTALDGIALQLRDRTLRLYPDDLLRRRIYSSFLPLPGGQVKAGLDVPTAIESLWLSAHLPDAAWDEQKPALRRFRTVEYVERPGAAPAELRAGRVINDVPHTVADYRTVALDGVRWLARMLQQNGRFQYDYDPITDAQFDLGYSLPRHSGSAYFLAFAHRKTGDTTARDAARLALDYAVAREVRSCGKAPGRCVGQGGVVDAGSAALTVVAMAEYERGTKEGRFVEPLKQVLEFLVWLQEPNGDFVHLYDVDRDERSPERLLYYSGEATLALIEAYRVLGDPALLPRIRSAMDYLTKESWSFFGSAYFFGEEHWVCIAANEAFPEVQDEAYLDFCERFAGFLREMQTAEGEPPYGYEGAYVVTPFLAPRTTPVAGRTEATVATYKLGVAMGRPNMVILEQIRRSLSFLVRMVYTSDSSPFFLRADRATGGMPGGFDDPVVRIDYVQHAGNALLGGADILADYELEP
jgi:hypothetical protein